MIGKIKEGLKIINNFVKKHLPSFIVGSIFGGLCALSIRIGTKVSIANDQAISDIIQDVMWRFEKLGPGTIDIDYVIDALWDMAVHPLEIVQSPNRSSIHDLKHI